MEKSIEGEAATFFGINPHIEEGVKPKRLITRGEEGGGLKPGSLI